MSHREHVKPKHPYRGQCHCYLGVWSHGVPLFVAELQLDYHPKSGSPAIDAGRPDPVHNDPDGSRLTGYYRCINDLNMQLALTYCEANKETL